MGEKIQVLTDISSGHPDGQFGLPQTGFTITQSITNVTINFVPITVEGDKVLIPPHPHQLITPQGVPTPVQFMPNIFTQTGTTFVDFYGKKQTRNGDGCEEDGNHTFQQTGPVTSD